MILALFYSFFPQYSAGASPPPVTPPSPGSPVGGGGPGGWQDQPERHSRHTEERERLIEDIERAAGVFIDKAIEAESDDALDAAETLQTQARMVPDYRVMQRQMQALAERAQAIELTGQMLVELQMLMERIAQEIRVQDDEDALVAILMAGL